MTDTTLLYLGAFCFGLMLVGLALTVREFSTMAKARRKLGRARSASEQPPAAPPHLAKSHSA